MDRRESIRLIALGSISGRPLLRAYTNLDEVDEKLIREKGSENRAAAWMGKFKDWETSSGRMEWEQERDKRLMSEVFFDEHEMKTIKVLVNIIIPEDKHSGSATDAGVPDFIEFIVKDMPEHQLPIRGGIRWVDRFMTREYNNPFKDCSKKQQIILVDQIAYPNKTKPDMKPGAAFFSLMRNLTATGFFTSKIGIEDIGYKGNTPNVWDGVPEDVLHEYNKSYSKKQLKECVKQENNGKLFKFEN